MPDLSWNRSYWNGKYDWKAGGEEWSTVWGNSEAQWYGSLFPRLHRFLPTSAVLEIAPGFGRWTQYLLPMCEELLGIDISAQCVGSCQQTFRAAKHAVFRQNDGLSLSAAPDDHFDLVFSFDSLVHAELDVFTAYVPQVLRKLKLEGVAFIHHSNLLPFGGSIGAPHARAASVSAQNVAALVERCGGKVLLQEIINWGAADLHDCLTLFARKDHPASVETVRLENRHFMEEANIIREFHSHYSRVGRPSASE